MRRFGKVREAALSEKWVRRGRRIIEQGLDSYGRPDRGNLMDTPFAQGRLAVMNVKSTVTKAAETQRKINSLRRPVGSLPVSGWTATQKKLQQSVLPGAAR